MSRTVTKNLEQNSSEAGFSLVETLPLIIVMSSLIGFLLGLWGMVHKNILASIASSNYAFETFNFRSNLMYFNDLRSNAVNGNSYELSQVRFHGYGDSANSSIGAFTTPYRFPAQSTVTEPPELHRVRIWNVSLLPDSGQGELDVGTKNPWVLVGYGICLSASCGEE